MHEGKVGLNYAVIQPQRVVLVDGQHPVVPSRNFSDFLAG